MGGGGAGGSKKKKKKKGGKLTVKTNGAGQIEVKDNAGYFKGLEAEALPGSDEEAADEGGSSTPHGLSVSQLSAPRPDKSHEHGPWVVDLTLSSGQVVVLGLDWLKDFKTTKGRPGPDKTLKYGEKDQVLRKYKEARKAEKKNRLKQQKQAEAEAGQGGDQLGQLLPLPGGGSQSQPRSAQAAAAPVPIPPLGLEVLPGLSFVAPEPLDDEEAQAWALPPTPQAKTEQPWQSCALPAPAPPLAHLPYCNHPAMQPLPMQPARQREPTLSYTYESVLR